MDNISRPAQADIACANGQQNHDFVASEAVRKIGRTAFNKEFSERNKITEVLLRSGMKKAPRGLQDCEALLI